MSITISLLASVFLASASPTELKCPKGKRCVVRHLLDGIVDNDTVQPAIDDIKAANNGGADEIILEINTPGGSVGEGFRLSREIEESDVPVTCVVDGAAESMGFFILQSCDKRLMTKRSVLMAHEPALSYPMERAQPNEWRSMAEMMKAEAELIAEHCQHRLKITMEEYVQKTNGGLMWFLTWKDALKYGAVDGVVKNAKTAYQRALKQK